MSCSVSQKTCVCVPFLEYIQSIELQCVYNVWRVTFFTFPYIENYRTIFNTLLLQPKCKLAVGVHERGRVVVVVVVEEGCHSREREDTHTHLNTHTHARIHTQTHTCEWVATGERFHQHFMCTRYSN